MVCRCFGALVRVRLTKQQGCAAHTQPAHTTPHTPVTTGTHNRPMCDRFYTRCMWAEGTYANYPDFCEDHQFHVIYCVTLAYVLYFEKFLTHDSRYIDSRFLKND